MATFALLVFLFLALCLYARYIEPHTIQVRKIRIDTGRSIGGHVLRITLLSDFHYPKYASFEMVRKAISLSDRFNPDVVLLLGDFFDKNRKDAAVLPQNVRETFGSITNRQGVFGVLGNHDHWFDEKAIRTRIASDTEIQLIDNIAVPIRLEDRVVYLVGVGDLWSENADYTRATHHVPHGAAILLLSHNPDVIEEIHDSRILVQ